MVRVSVYQGGTGPNCWLCNMWHGHTSRDTRDTRDPGLTSTASRMAGIMGRGAEQQLDDTMSHSLVRHLSPSMFGVGHHYIHCIDPGTLTVEPWGESGVASEWWQWKCVFAWQRKQGLGWGETLQRGSILIARLLTWYLVAVLTTRCASVAACRASSGSVARAGWVETGLSRADKTTEFSGSRTAVEWGVGETVFGLWSPWNILLVRCDRLFILTWTWDLSVTMVSLSSPEYPET